MIQERKYHPFLFHLPQNQTLCAEPQNHPLPTPHPIIDLKQKRQSIILSAHPLLPSLHEYIAVGSMHKTHHTDTHIKLAVVVLNRLIMRLSSK